LAVAYADHDAWLIAAPFIAAWMLSPAIAWWVSRSPRPDQSSLSDAETQSLRLTARRTWHFFETFVTGQENGLPPDNFQEQPVSRLASRTSPTNMGLALLSNLAARDFGYISSGQLLRRTTAALETMERLERHRSHFYNWYDTRHLVPLDPKYVSSVDSGNLAADLLVLGNGCREIIQEPFIAERPFKGVGDALHLLREALEEIADTQRRRSSQRYRCIAKARECELYIHFDFETFRARRDSLKRRLQPESLSHRIHVQHELFC